MTLRLCPRCPRVLLPLMASLGTAPRACGAGDALCGWGAASCLDALEGSGLSCSWILLLVCQEKSALGCAGAWGSPPSASAAESSSLLCWDVSLGSQISCSSASPSHAAQHGSHGWAGAACWLLSPGAQQHRARHFPLLLQNPQLLWSEAEQEVSLQGLFWLWAAGCQRPASFFAGVEPQHRSGEEEGNARVQKSV